jgi:hypothetical protein
MRERVRVYGGRLTAGPDGAGFLVEAVLPLVAVPASGEPAPAARS